MFIPSLFSQQDNFQLFPWKRVVISCVCSAIPWNAGVSRCSLLPAPKPTDTSAFLTKGMRRKK